MSKHKGKVKNCIIDWNMFKQCYQMLLCLDLGGKEIRLYIDEMNLTDSDFIMSQPKIMLFKTENE